ncbi:MAG: FKBP-type peptidyl-prolyl cis-trans isomerase [Candidatus Wallbacteria bacterium]|nr:FKBP-type peptidyl-prolyl cis-trans isomerase [Candidatus Wallbacteria bacterium]
MTCLLATVGCGPASEQSPAPDVTKAPPAPAAPPTKQATSTAAASPEEANTVSTPSGLKYIDLAKGTGATPSKGKTVEVHYTGYLTNGKKFDSSVDRKIPFQFVIGEGQVIAGWDEGVLTMQTGGKRKLIIPSELAYGDRGFGDVIPPRSTLIFEVELLGVK